MIHPTNPLMLPDSRYGHSMSRMPGSTHHYHVAEEFISLAAKQNKKGGTDWFGLPHADGRPWEGKPLYRLFAPRRGGTTVISAGILGRRRESRTLIPFIGIRPYSTSVPWQAPSPSGAMERTDPAGGVLRLLKELLAGAKPARIPGLRPFTSGAVASSPDVSGNWKRRPS